MDPTLAHARPYDAPPSAFPARAAPARVALACCSNPACLAVLPEANPSSWATCPGCDVVAYCSPVCLGADKPAHLVNCHRIAEEWFSQESLRARTGHPESQFHVARCLARGRGTDVDHAAAFGFFLRAAEAGHAAAASALAGCLRSGTGVEADPAEALRWFTRAAEMGDVDAQAYVGACYLTGGCGARPDASLAAHWLQAAASSGHVESQVSLGGCFEFGAGVPRDTAQARRWYEAALGASEGGHHAGAESGLARLRGR